MLFNVYEKKTVNNKDSLYCINLKALHIILKGTLSRPTCGTPTMFFFVR